MLEMRNSSRPSKDHTYLKCSTVRHWKTRISVWNFVCRRVTLKDGSPESICHWMKLTPRPVAVAVFDVTNLCIPHLHDCRTGGGIRLSESNLLCFLPNIVLTFTDYILFIWCISEMFHITKIMTILRARISDDFQIVLCSSLISMIASFKTSAILGALFLVQVKCTFQQRWAWTSLLSFNRQCYWYNSRRLHTHRFKSSLMSACSKESTIWPQPDTQRSSKNAAHTDPG